jgi:hypothetical protein
MFKINAEPKWPDVQGWDIDDPVDGGTDGLDNIPLRQLAERTEFLNEKIDSIDITTNADLGLVLDNLAKRIAYLERQISGSGPGSGSGNRTDITNVTNNPSYNPGTGKGGITWTDPDGDFDCIEIYYLDGNGNKVIVAEVPPGVQFWQPPEGNQEYYIRVKYRDGSYSTGVELPQTYYTIDYTAKVKSITIPLLANNQLIVSFDNYVSCTSAAGFFLADVVSPLVFVDQPDGKSVRLQLASGIFSGTSVYTLSYDGSGTLKQADGSPVAAWYNYPVTKGGAGGGGDTAAVIGTEQGKILVTENGKALVV